jgi:flagellar basal body-associated protein FliL
MASITANQQNAPQSRVTLMLAILGGLAFGGGGATAWFMLTNGGVATAKAQPAETYDVLTYVKIQRLTVPLADVRGNLISYLTLDLALDVKPGQAEFVKQRIPMIRHQINALVSREVFIDPANDTRFDYARAAPAMLKAANMALETPAIRSLSIVSALPS